MTPDRESRVSVVVGSASASAPAAGRSIHGGTGVLDGFVHRDDKAGGLGGRRQRIDSHDGRLPHAGLKVIGDVLVVHVDAVPHTSLAGKKREEGLVIGLVRTCGGQGTGKQTHANVQGEAETGPCCMKAEHLRKTQRKKKEKKTPTKRNKTKKPLLSVNSATEAS